NKLADRSFESCARCIQSSRIAKHCIVAVGIKTYLTVPTWKPLVEGHCLIVPAMHYPCLVSLDEDVYDEMKIWRKGLVAMWNDQNMDCVFIEMAKNVKQRQHMVIECIPLPSEVGDTAPIYFKKAIDECEREWSDNKKLIDLSKKNGDIRRAIPKGFSYFSIDFGLQPGYAHVIEDESRFPQYFAYETIGGMLDLLPNVWRKKEAVGTEAQMGYAKHLKKLWGPYDWTEKVKSSIAEERK
uniref:CwfJ_C_2 domain-containing protein n=1 Tax=Syphacia muris TaxID=451379 RepID=A0A0N5ATJ5_9BILA